MKGRHATQQQTGRYEGLLVPIPKKRNAADDLAVNYVSKKAKTAKGLEVVFDPARHKDFITGFRKRKQQRRKVAEQQIKKKEREERLANRAEKRAKLKEQLGLDDKWGASSDEAEEAQLGPEATGNAKPLNVAVYEQQGTRTVVTTAPLALHSDSEKDGEGSGDDDDAATVPATAALAVKQTREQVQSRQKHPALQRKGGKQLKHTGKKKHKK